jgi:hypothetical protein
VLVSFLQGGTKGAAARKNRFEGISPLFPPFPPVQTIFPLHPRASTVHLRFDHSSSFKNQKSTIVNRFFLCQFRRGRVFNHNGSAADMDELTQSKTMSQITQISTDGEKWGEMGSDVLECFCWRI